MRPSGSALQQLLGCKLIMIPIKLPGKTSSKLRFNKKRCKLIRFLTESCSRHGLIEIIHTLGGFYLIGSCFLQTVFNTGCIDQSLIIKRLQFCFELAN